MDQILSEGDPIGTARLPSESLCRADQQALSGAQLRTGIRQSMPSSSIES
jgi:hypothetical protein